MSADLADLLDEEWRDKSLEVMLRAPVTAVTRVTEDDAEMLKQIFNIKTVGELVRNKHFRMAHELLTLTEAEAEMWH